MKQIKITILISASFMLSACGSSFKSVSSSIAANGATTQQGSNNPWTTATAPTAPTSPISPTAPATPSLSSSQIQSLLGSLAINFQSLFQIIEAGYGPGVTYDISNSKESVNETVPCPGGGTVSISLSGTISGSYSTATWSGPTSASGLTFANCGVGGAIVINGSLSVPSFSKDTQIVYIPGAGNISSQVAIQALGSVNVILGGSNIPCPVTLSLSESSSYIAQTTADRFYHEHGSGEIQLSGSICGFNGSQQIPLPISLN